MISMRSLIIVSLLLIFTRDFAQLPRALKKQLQTDSVDLLLKSIYKSNAPGISICIIREGKVFLKNSYGIADLETKTNLDPATNFNVGSLTKQFTAFAILQLAESKRLSMDDHLSKFFPELNKKVANATTVKELLTHTSGIVDHYDLVDTTGLKHAHIYDVLNAIKNTDFTYFVPGSHFRYSNTAYCLLALIIEKISGMSYAQYLEKNIFMPLEMNQTVVWGEKKKIRNEASGYEFDKATGSFRMSGADENIFFSTEGDGGIYTSIDDYQKWFAALQSGKIFSKKIIDQARSPQFPIDKENHLSYGYGWFVGESSVPAKVYHSGSNGGFRSYSFSIPQENSLIIIFSNRDDVDLEKLVKKIYSILSS